MKRKLFVWLLLVLYGNFVSSLKCYLTGFPWPKDCDDRIAERHGTDPACLTAFVLDEHKNPIEYRQCSKYGATELPGGCDILRKHRIVTHCTLCAKDYCNKPEGFNEGSQMQPFLMLTTISLIAVLSNNVNVF